MFTEQKITNQDITDKNRIFCNLEGLYSNCFLQKDWLVWYFESVPFFDRDIFPSIALFFKDVTNGFKLTECPMHEGNKVIYFETIPNYEVFNEIQQEYYLNFMGGIAYDSSLSWGMHSDPDNSILIVGSASNILSKETLNSLKSNPSLISKKELIKKYGYL